MDHIAKFITGKSFCPFGDAAVWGLQSNLAKFPEAKYRFELIDTKPTQGEERPALPVRPVYRPDVGEQSKLHDSTMTPHGESPSALSRHRWWQQD